jgi:NAD(P)-dependent dehydrogenase (short-subunit alcohol dehydrogenase family)
MRSQSRYVIWRLPTIVAHYDRQDAVAAISKHTATLDNVYINSGVMLGFGPIFDVKSSDLLENLNANTVGPHNIFKAFAPLVIASKSEKRLIATTSSVLGSIGALPYWGPSTKAPYGFEHIPTACYSVSKYDILVASTVCQLTNVQDCSQLTDPSVGRLSRA